jgi:hypothetical protein
MNKQDANAIRLLLNTAASAGLIRQELAEEVGRNTHIFIRKNHFRWRLQRFQARLGELETQIRELRKVLSHLDLFESSLAKVAARHQDLALAIKRDLALAIEQVDLQLPPDPTRVPSQDATRPIDDPDALALGQFKSDLSEGR